MTRLGSVALCLSICLAPAGSAAVPVTQVGAFTFSMNVSGSILQVRYDANLSLSGSYPQVRRIVVLVHGSNRNARNALDNLVAAATIAGANDGTNLLVAPQFLLEEDVTAHLLPAQTLFWSDAGWKQGDPSLSTAAHPRPAQLSSFAVLDSMLVRTAALNPNLQSFVLAGHSAGGQLVNRFAAGSTAADAVRAAYGVEAVYVAANPSSYLYLDPQRVVPGRLNQFAVPPARTIQSCPGYNDYKYGLLNRNAYMSRLSSSQIVARYRGAHVVVLLGELDNDPASPDLDTSCAAMLQGSNRLERGRIYGYGLERLFGPAIASTHPTLIVPGVGHNSHDMFTSPCGVAALFWVGTCDPVDVEPAAAPHLLLDSRPNPFRTRATISYQLPAGHQHPTVRIYDVRGRLVRTLQGEPSPDGSGTVVWDARSETGEPAAAGVYLYQLQDGDATAVHRSALLR